MSRFNVKRSLRLLHFYCFLNVLLFNPATILAQIEIDTPDFIYQEDFNVLPFAGNSSSVLWADNNTLNGWWAEHDQQDISILYGGNHANGSSGTPGIKSFGVNNDLALGALPANSTGNIALELRLTNISGETLNAITISFTGEQWRYGEAEQTLNSPLQSLQFSYCIAHDPNKVLENDMFLEDYIQVPELSFVGPINQWGGSNSIDGNMASNSTQLSYTFNISLPHNHSLLLRWLDTNESILDNGMAIDDLSIQFSPNSFDGQEIYEGDMSMYHYIGGSLVNIIKNINDPGSFEDPRPNDDPSIYVDDWRVLVNYMMDGNIAQARVQAEAFGYKIIYYLDSSGDEVYAYYVLRHNGSFLNDKHWGTYIFNVNPHIQKILNISAPHPLFDRSTGRQSAYMYYGLRDWSYLYAITGAHRCITNTPSNCHGSTEVCTGGSENYKLSDQAHYLGVFQATLEEVAMANLHPNAVFPQFHQFAKFIWDGGGEFQEDDPDFILSNGTVNTPPNTDYVTTLKDYIEDNSNFVADRAHGINDQATKLLAENNTLGRFLNNYNEDICGSSEDPDVPSDRFMHLEQQREITEQESHYELVKNALIAAYGLADAPLSITLNKIEIKKYNDQVELNWSTSLEFNNDLFVIQRSSDGLEYTDIASVDGAGNSTSLLHYSFVDRSPLMGRSYYRIKQTDFNGEYAYFGPVTIVFNNLFYNRLLFNNPVKAGGNATFYIHTRSDEKVYIELYNSIGKRTLHQEFTGNTHGFEIKMDFNPGVYFVVVTTLLSKQSGKIVIE